MKKLSILTILLLCVATLLAQAPEKFSYQAVVRNASNALVINAPVGVRVSILQGGVNGTIVYMETHTAVTNANGLLTLEIGSGSVQQGAFADIDWANGPYFLKTETDPDGGSNYSVTSTQQLLSVPYALYAKEAGNVFSGDYNDLMNTPDIPQNVSAFTNDAGYITAEDFPMQVNADWNATSGVAQILNKPELFSGDYNDLTNKPDLCECLTAADVQALINSSLGAMQQQLDSLQNVVDALTGGATTATLPSVTTSMVSNITETTATCGGNVTDDGGATVYIRGVCWSTSQNPTVSDSHTTDGSGTGAFTSSLSGLFAGITYYVRAYATNSVGTVYGNEISFTTSMSTPVSGDAIPCPGTPMVTDHEGNVYNTVQIGNQCWMRDNLRTTTSPSTGTYLIPDASADPTVTGKQAHWYNNDSATYAPMNYGLLYNWNAAVDTFNTAYGETSVNSSNSNAVSVSFMGNRRGICPAGWHLPSDAEWAQLTNYVRSQSEYTCGGYSWKTSKALASETGWSTSSYNCAVGNDPSANNATGFSAVPAGLCTGSSFDYAGVSTYFWSSTQGYSNNAWIRSLGYNGEEVNWNTSHKLTGYSVRCLRDSTSGGGTSAMLPTVTTSAVSNITATTATCGGNVTADGGAMVTARGVCWSTSQNPTISDSHTTDGNGTGSFMSSISGLTAGITYYVRAYASNIVGTAYGEVVVFTTLTDSGGAVVDEKSCPNAPTVTDHEGNVYATVQIGNQCWMRDNLRTTTSPSTGTYLIPDASAGCTETGKQARWYNNDSATYAPMNYGLLYNWNAAVDTFNTTYGETSLNTDYNNAVLAFFTGHRRGICPAGWHLPNAADWTALTNYVSSQSEYTCGGDSWEIAKALASETGWSTSSYNCAVGNDPSVNNATGFSAVPAGRIGWSGFGELGYEATFWSASVYGNWGNVNGYDSALYVGLNYNSVSFYGFGSNTSKYAGFSVRCLHDSDSSGGTSVGLPTVITDSVIDITATTATCGGNVISDGGASVTRGVCWSTYQNPEIGNSHTHHTTDGSGIGSFTSTITGLMANTTYYVRAYAMNSVYMAYGNEFSFTTPSGSDEQGGLPCPGTPTVTDIDGNTYNTVQIGNQCWMKENLRTKHFANGSTIPAGGSNTSSSAPYYYNYSSSDIPLEERGYLYNWPAVMHGASSSSATPSGVQGICPNGWHLPSDAEWTTMEQILTTADVTGMDWRGGHAGKLAGGDRWNSSTTTNSPGNMSYVDRNASGFTAVPAGYHSSSSFYNAGTTTYFWSSSLLEGMNYYAYTRGLYYENDDVCRSNGSKSSGYSVRCLRD